MEFTEATCKLLVTCGGVACVAELDRVAEGVGMLSPLVDDLVSELPAPISTSRVSESVGFLGGTGGGGGGGGGGGVGGDWDWGGGGGGRWGLGGGGGRWGLGLGGGGGGVGGDVQYLIQRHRVRLDRHGRC